MANATVVLYSRIPEDLKARIDVLVEAGAHSWPRLTQQGVVIALLQLGLDEMSARTLAEAKNKPKLASKRAPKLVRGADVKRGAK